MQRLRYKFLTIALDLRTHFYLNSHGYTSYYLDHFTTSTNGENENNISGESSAFGSTSFKRVTYRKIFAVYELLALNYDVIFTDTDIAFLADPLPYLRFKNVDMAHSYNLIPDSADISLSDYVNGPNAGEGNTG